MYPAIGAIPTSRTYQEGYHGWMGCKPVSAKYSSYLDGTNGLDG
jgi:hypothetical protein